MKLSGFQRLAASSLLLVALVSSAETRPQYGGTLHISVHESPMSLDPSDSSQPDSFARRNITPLIFETLVMADDAGSIHPGLATGWMSESVGRTQFWYFRIRKGVTLQDGTPLTPEIAVASLRTANPLWKITSSAGSVSIESDTIFSFHLAEELALPRNAIVKKSDDGKPIGTGPFHVADWHPGRKLTLAAEEDYWGGRPYIDAIEIEFGKNYREQLVSQELGKADLIEISPEQSHRLSMTSQKLATSKPIELLALVFARDAQSPEEKSLREALALCIERTSIANVILQGSGKPTASILPNWMSGYGFAFSSEADLARARYVRREAKAASPWTIFYDATDPLAGLLADRIALNAQDAGLQLQPTKAAGANLRIARIVLPPDPIDALSAIAASMGLPPPQINSDSSEDIYSAEKGLLSPLRLIPLFHLPIVYSTSSRLKGWSPRADGSWNLADTWLARAPSGGLNP